MTLIRRIENEDRSDGFEGTYNSTTPVTAVSAPSAGFVRVVDFLGSVNLDTAPVSFHAVKVVAGPALRSISTALAVPINESRSLITAQTPVRLREGESITVELLAVVASAQPEWVSSWVDVPIAT